MDHDHNVLIVQINAITVGWSINDQLLNFKYIVPNGIGLHANNLLQCTLRECMGYMQNHFCSFLVLHKLGAMPYVQA